MSEAPKDGGPAFPSVLYSHERAENWSTDGMSLRDWFAGQALAGRMINGFASSADSAAHARVAYAMADAMLFERSKAGLPQ
jgi:hypothetical protein